MWLLGTYLAISAPQQVHAITFRQVYENALSVDPALRSSRYSLDANNENIAIARSRLLPQILFQGTSNQLTQTTTQAVPGNFNISRSFTGPSVNHQLSVRQGLVRSKELIAVEFAELQLQYGELKYLSDKSDLWLRVAFAWIDLVGANKIAEAYEMPLGFLEAAAKQERNKLMQGDGTKDALAEAEAQYEQANSLYRQAIFNVKAKQYLFELLTQMDSNLINTKNFEIQHQAVFSENNEEQLWRKISQQSYELKLAEVTEKIQKTRIRMASADHLPTLDLVGAWNYAKNDATSTQGYQYRNSQIGLQFTLPIYSGNAISATERQAKLMLDASVSESQAVANRLKGDFQLLWSTWLGQTARVQAGQKLVESSKVQLRAAKLNYFEGVKSIADVANAELVYSRRIADQINAIIDYYKNTARLFRDELKID